MPSPTLPIKRVVISAPFGNYISHRDATSTVGTFTADRRRGRLFRCLWTIRYSRYLKSWINKIGLRNPGIDWLVQKSERSKFLKPIMSQIISVMGLDANGRSNLDLWIEVIAKASKCQPAMLELNVSCPNVGKRSVPEGVYEAAVSRMGVDKCCVKLPPVLYEGILDEAMDAGIRIFHCCNTIPTEKGGISGKALKPISLEVVRRLKSRYPDDIKIIGGGGITCEDDILTYIRAGADCVAIGSMLLNPLNHIRRFKRLVEYAVNLDQQF